MASKNTWMRRQQCPCGDWKCFITRGDSEEATASSQLANDVDDLSSKSMVSPYVGMVFKSDDDAFEYYGNFARKNGFSIRKERSRLSPNIGIHKRDFVCYRSGFASVRRRQTMGEHQRDRKSVRCGCDAKLFLSKELVNEVFQWFVVQFSNVHNHELLEDDLVRLLPAYRKIDEVAQERILLLSKAGFPIHKIYKVLETERGIQGGKLTFVEKDVRNFIQNRKKVVQENDDLLNEKRDSDVVELLEACKATKEGDPHFVYGVSMDDNDKVESIAWSYGDSIRSYTMFGDVVYFDITYQSVAHSMIFGAWLGIDHHGKTILFGCALLSDDTPRSLAWALQTFVHFINGRYPQTIVTDLDPGLRDAIESELPNTKHVISILNILPKFSGWFSLSLGVRYSEFRDEFDALHDAVDSADDFELRWSHLVGRYGLISDKHISFLFSIRTFWASPYIKGCFTAKMATTSYSKSVEAFLRGVFKANLCLRGLFEQVGASSVCKFQGLGDVHYTHIRTSLPMEEHARSILTPFAFNALQHELVLCMQYAVSEMSNGSYLVRHFKKMDGEHLVSWKPVDEHVHCSCKELESSGILCRHALRVLLMKNYFQIPEKYFPSRWRQESSLSSYDSGTGRNSNDEWYEEFLTLSGTLFTESSITKERTDYARKELRRELMRLVNAVGNMPTEGKDATNVDLIPSPTD